jgi:hypothetical protein
VDPARSDTTGARNPPPVDLPALSAEIRQLGRLMENEATRSSAIRRADSLYRRTDLPDGMRAQAAGLFVDMHIALDQSDSACAWVGRAIALDSGNPSYRQVRTMLGCAQ